MKRGRGSRGYASCSRPPRLRRRGQCRQGQFRRIITARSSKGCARSACPRNDGLPPPCRILAAMCEGPLFKHRHHRSGRSGMTRFHPRRRFTLGALDAAFAAACRRSLGHGRTAVVDPLRSFDLTSSGRRTGHSSIAYSMTSSARARSDCGTVRPSALAVLRLMTSSNSVGRWTGRSLGFSPARILPAYWPTCRAKPAIFAP